MTGQRAPRPLPLPRPPPRRPRPRLPAPEQESAAGRPDPPKGPEAGGTRVPGPWGRTPSRKLPQVQSIDTAPRGEGAPSFSRAQRPGSSGRRPSLASDPAPGRGAARAPALRREAAGAGKRGQWAGESGGASCRGPGEEPRWREPLPQARAEDLTDPDCHSQGRSGPEEPPELNGSGNRQEGWRMDFSQASPQFQSKHPPSDPLPDSPSAAHVKVGVSRAGTHGQAHRTLCSVLGEDPTPAIQGWTPIAA
ncbi:uncharacterized protein LOC123615655 isoform X1 [Camelus bactrianus]|uniref:Uncharacterized protein LOC123615655 isoform X1 n=1 Tax=Camelus bactrianus TaxID=9837 RepID=A0AC58NLX9_CAMBA